MNFAYRTKINKKDEDDGSETTTIDKIPIDGEGNELFTEDHPANVQLTGSIVEDGAIYTLGKKAVTFSFKIEIEPGSQRIIRNDDVDNEIDFGDLREFKSFYYGVDSGPISGDSTHHDFTIRAVFKPKGSDGNINESHVKEQEGKTSGFIPKTDFSLHKGSLRLRNESDETQKYMINIGFYYS